jgi:hypothetical protein
VNELVGLSLADFIKIDKSKMDAKKVKDGAALIAQGIEPGVITPANIDKYFFDNVTAIIERLILGEEGGPVVIGDDQPVTVEQVEGLIASYPGMPTECCEKFRRNPKLVKRLEQIEEKDRTRVAMSPLLLQLLLILGPMLLQWLLNRKQA